MPAREECREHPDDVILDAFESLCLKYGMNGTIVMIRREAVHGRKPDYESAMRTLMAKDAPENIMAVAHCMRMELHAAALELWTHATEREHNDE